MTILRMSSVEVKLLRKNRRWDLFDKNMFSSASIVDLTMLLTGKADPQDLHQICTNNFKGKIRIQKRLNHLIDLLTLNFQKLKFY